MTSFSTRAVAAAALAVAVTLPLAGQASADRTDVPGTAGAKTLTNTPEPARDPFYEPPATIPSTPGTLIRSEPAPLLLDPLGLSKNVVTATRVMYSSTDGKGHAIAVTGTVFVPKTTYVGRSARPLVSYAAGTQGMGDACAPSRQMESLVEYEGLGIAPLVGRGYAVSMTDYQGLGTPGTHTYMVREAQGRAVLDMARATKNLKGSGITNANPVGLMGYSQPRPSSPAAMPRSCRSRVRRSAPRLPTWPRSARTSTARSTSRSPPSPCWASPSPRGSTPTRTSTPRARSWLRGSRTSASSTSSSTPSRTRAHTP